MKVSTSIFLVLTCFLFTLFFPPLAHADTYTTVFSDDFTGADGTALTTHNSNWNVATPGLMTQLQSNTLFNPDASAYIWQELPNHEVSDYCVSADVQFPIPYQFFLYSRYKNVPSSGYTAIINPNGGSYDLSAKWFIESTVGELGSGQTRSISDGWHNYKFCAVGTQTSLYFDNELISSGTDTNITGPGKVAMFMGAQEHADNFLLQSVNAAPPVVGNISLSPANANVTVGEPFTVDMVVNGGGTAFNAAQVTAVASANLSVTGVHSPISQPCGFQYTDTPSIAHLSFAGAIFNGSSENCNVYRMTVTPTAAGTGTITLSNGSIKSFANASELLSTLGSGTFTISEPSSSIAFQSIDDTVQGTGLNQWNFVSGGWSHCTNCNDTATFYNSSVSWDNTTNDYATLKFNGSKVKLYGFTDPRDGIAAISIDDGPETMVDFYSPTRAGNVLLWTSPTLSESQHTLKIRTTGNHSSGGTDNYIGVDRAEVPSSVTLNFAVNPFTTDTYGSEVTVTGTKDEAITHIFVNGSETGVTYPTATTWQATLSVSALGNNTFVVYGQDAQNNQTASQSLTVKKHTLGDINGDGVVNIVDASLFAVDWGKTSGLTYPLSDMDGNGAVDLTDFSILAKLEQ